MLKFISLLLAGACIPAAALAQPVCPGVRVPLKTTALSGAPYADVTLGRVTGPWLIDYGWSVSTISSSYWKKPAANGSLSLSGMSFPHVPAGARGYPVQAMGIAHRGVGQQRGVLGIDLLKDVTAEFHFEDASAPHVVVSKGACTAMPLYDEHFFRIRQTGYFSDRPETHTSGLANIPVVFLRLEEREPAGGAQPEQSPVTWAQIDTGYDDSFWPYSIDINEAYLAQIRKLKVAPVKVGTVQVSGCGNEDSVRDVYTVPGFKLRITDETGIPLARWFDSYHLILKPKQTKCGGIGPMSVPAAQLGASFLRAFGTTIFMPSTADVWIRTSQPMPVAPEL